MRLGNSLKTDRGTICIGSLLATSDHRMIWKTQRSSVTMQQPYKSNHMTVKQLGLPVRMQRFIASEIKAGRYRSEQELIQAGIKLLEQEQKVMQKQSRLQEAIQKGIDQADRGQGVLLRSRDEISQFSKSLVTKAIGKNKRT